MRNRLARVALLLILGGLASCALLPDAPPSPPAPVRTVTPGGPALRLDERVPNEPEHPRARWVPAAYADLPGWGSDRLLAAWPAMRAGCASPAAPVAWQGVCAELLRSSPRDDTEARLWIEQRLQVFRLEAPPAESGSQNPVSQSPSATIGLATGYFEPLIEARRKPQGAFRTPLWAPPADLAQRKPWWTRREIDQQPEAQAALRGRELAWVADPLDALMLQVQGSGRVRMTEPDGSERTLRLAYAATNDQPYKSLGRWLIEQGELRPGEASWPAIKDWVRRNPRRLGELLGANPRVIFFREEPLTDAEQGPRGAQGVPLTPGRSIAVDPGALPYGSAVWLDTTEPLSARPLQRLVMAQDTGSAITGAVRADFFWGWGDDAETQAGRMKQALRAWVLWPRP